MIVGIASADYLRSDRAEDGIERWGGSGWARLGQYIQPLRDAGYEVHVGTLWREGTKGLSVEDDQLIKVMPDVILMQRLMHDTVDDAIRFARAAGQFVINDVDDWYWGLDPNNQAFLASHPKYNDEENIHFYGPTLAASDMLTVSTPYLAERLMRKSKNQITVIPNYVDISRFTVVEQQPGTPLFGWAGSVDHRSGDLETVSGVFRRPIQEGELRMHHSGEWKPGVFAERMGVDPALISTSPRATADEYPSLLTFQVGIIPLRDTPFNYAKSDIKGLEYAASGIPFIASSTPSYEQLWQDWDGAFRIAKRPKDWISGIKRYLDYENRVEDQKKVLDLVRTRDLHYGVARWIELLEGLRK